eukprot:5210971-Pleurochrysis_carterae.AAC.1
MGLESAEREVSQVAGVEHLLNGLQLDSVGELGLVPADCHSLELLPELAICESTKQQQRSSRGDSQHLFA